MIQVQINVDIQTNGTTKININNLEREDASKEERLLAEAIEKYNLRALKTGFGDDFIIYKKFIKKDKREKNE
jgi:hypothetical protein